jgi:hypothetical protein
MYRIAIVVYTLISITGLAIFAYSASIQSYTTAIVGRAVFGMGAEG